ncbi:protein IWS1 homolog 1 [Mercurialis annua]|uniref:protein IWS1 homolog 1 n=1 Tax=Mercurialis annua TaxID=3986 RepID=UPI002160871F|nr:protein IWS1 homolog 1 [Mercurialis annua]
MAYEDDQYRDEDGEPLMDYDDVPSPEQQAQENDLLLEDDDVDGWGEQESERPRTPVYNHNDKAEKPRKRLVKKNGNLGIGEKGYSSNNTFEIPELVDEDDVDDGDRFGKKRKSFGKDSYEKSSSKKFSRVEKKSTRGGSSSSKSKGKLYGKEDGEVKEMWDTIAGGDSEDDQEGLRTMDDENFIDDTGVDPADRYGSDNERRSPRDAPQAEEGEEDEEIQELFKMGKKKKKNEKSPAEIALLVEKVMAELEVTAEDDAFLNKQGKPAISKLRKLPLLTDVLSKKQLQQEFIDHGVLTLLKTWLEPLPDGSLPNINIRAAILRILTDFHIDLEQYDRREQLKKSGLGKVIMFLSKSDEETTSNRKLAKDLVDKWSRPIFNKSTRFEDMRNIDDDRPARRPAMRRPVNSTSGMESRDGDLDLDMSRERRSGQSSSKQHASRPEATPLDFLVRPQSKIDPEEIRARAKQVVQDQRRLKMNKKLQQLKAPKKKQLQATKLSVEGRGMLKYL